jgi:hypothetical protein
MEGWGNRINNENVFVCRFFKKFITDEIIMKLILIK